jgi:hypothetical protein
MQNTEAESVLAAYLANYRKRSHKQLAGLLQAPVADQVAGLSGRRYQVVVQASWTGAPGGELRVVGGVDHGGWQRFNPIIESFLSKPAGVATPAAQRGSRVASV